MIEVVSENYTLLLSIGELPLLHDEYARRARLHDDLGIHEPHGRPAFVAVKTSEAVWPLLALSFRAEGWPGLPVGILIVPGTDLLLIGSGERLMAYVLKSPRKLWQEDTFVGFWSWARWGDVVLMCAECELAAYSLRGDRLWSEWVESPWGYTVTGERIDLDVMGEKSVVSLHGGRQRRPVAP